MNELQMEMLKKVENFVTNLFLEKVSDIFLFHNIIHTKQVVANAQVIADFYQFTDEEKLIISISAWFHDTGFSTGIAEGHELASAKIASTFLQTQNLSQERIALVVSCIEATKLPQQPTNGMAKVICDADLMHLGTNKFLEKTILLKKEIEKYKTIHISELDWVVQNIKFLEKHQYFTGYCQLNNQPEKQNWLKYLKTQVLEIYK